MMNFGVFNDKLEDMISSLKKDLLPVYKKGDVAKLVDEFEKFKVVDTVQVDCPEFTFDFELKQDEKDPHATDFDNVVTLHSRMKDLPQSFAANPAFWAWECHNDFSDYIHNRSETRIKGGRSAYTDVDVLRDFFCRTETGGTRRALVVNPLSRLWWAGHLLRDEANAEDPYHFVRLFTSSAFNSKMVLFASSTAANNPEIAMGMLDAIEAYKAEANLDDITRAELQVCTKFLNSIGAVRMIDTLGRAKIKEICLEQLRKTNNDQE